MLEELRLENFKAFKLLDNLDIKPITILCGTNSCGKSSILQSILLTKQTIETKQLGQTLLLNGRFTHLGMFDNIIFGKRSQNEVVLQFSCFWKRDTIIERSSGVRLVIPVRFILERVFPEKYLKIHGAKYLFHYRIALKLGDRRSPRTHLKPVLVNALELSAEIQLPGNRTVDGPHVSFKKIEGEKGVYSMTWSNIHSEKNKSGQGTCKVSFENLMPDEVTVVEANKRKRTTHPVSFDIWMFSEFLQQTFATYRYIGPLREEPSRRYIYEDEVIEIGLKGENAAYICLTDYDNKISDCYLFDNDTDSFYKCTEAIKLGEALTNWLETMSINGFVPTPSNEIVYLNLESATSKNTLVNIADVGFGVSQVLPILLEGLRMPMGHTLILEQPEIHLHPKLQMQMADYFISLALSKKRVIVETHSDHIVNRLARRIVEDTQYNYNELISIYFITPTPHGSKWEKVNIDPDKGIVNWPEEFFDQTATELQKTIQAGLKKRMSK
jgi:predicted ATPase